MDEKLNCGPLWAEENKVRWAQKANHLAQTRGPKIIYGGLRPDDGFENDQHHRAIGENAKFLS